MATYEERLREALMEAAKGWPLHPVCRSDQGCPLCEKRQAVIDRVRGEVLP